jgi:hypothetical protein
VTAYIAYAPLDRFESAELCAECGEKIGCEDANGCSIHNVFFHQRCCRIWRGERDCVHPLTPSRRAIAHAEAVEKGSA